MRVFVTGGTGDLGHRLVERLQEAGQDVLVGTRSPAHGNQVRYDLVSGPEEGSLDDVDVLVHLASNPLAPDDDVEGAESLWEAACDAGVGHVVYVSIVGIDRHPYPYYRAKLEVEKSLEASGLPYTILRTTPFHGLIPRFADEISRRIGFLPMPGGLRFQPVDPELVADRLVDLIQGPPAGRVPDLAGPEILPADEMVDQYLERTGKRVLRIRLPFWGKSIAGFRRGEHLAPGVDSGGRPYVAYLAEMPRHESDPVAVSLRLVSLTFLATMVWMLAWPSGFQETLAGFGEFNRHFVRDTAAFILPLAVILWMAASRPGWRVPVIGIALVQNGLHVVNHLIDIGNAEPSWQGPANLAALLLLELALWQMLVSERRRPGRPA